MRDTTQAMDAVIDSLRSLRTRLLALRHLDDDPVIGLELDHVILILQDVLPHAMGHVLSIENRGT